MNLLHDGIAQGHFALNLEARDFPSIFAKVVRHLVDQQLVSTDIAEQVE